MRWRHVGAVAALASLASCGSTGTDAAAPRSTSTTAPTTTVTATSDAPSAMRVDHLQIDPPVRDVRVRIAGTVVSTDSSGRIDLPSDAPDDAEVVVLGYSVSPPVRQVRFVQWADGDPSSVRDVDLTSDVPVIEVEVLHRVRVVATDPAPVRFESVAGPVELTPGVPAWVPALRAGDDALIGYRPESSPASPPFLPSPEARWSL